MDPTVDAREARTRLIAAKGSPRFTEVVEQHGIELLVIFGSAIRPDATPADLDLAVGHDGRADLTRLMEDLYALTGFERFDLLDLQRAGIVARAEALGDGRSLFEARRGTFAERQAVALATLWDTRWLRDLEPAQLAGAWTPR